MSTTPSTQQLFRVTITQYKTFFVEATSQDAVLHHPRVEDEEESLFGEFDWEHDETEARPLSAEEAAAIYKRRPNEIVPADDDDSGDGTEVDV